MVAVLYVQERSTYHALDCDPWPASRDARQYAGPGPIVAHPPCGPWGRLSHMCVHQDRTLAPIAVGQVQRWGGVLEHPAHSKLFAHMGLPLPGWLPDDHGGITIEINQASWDHDALKPTWLYIVGRPADMPAFPPRVVRDPLAYVTRGRKLAGWGPMKRSRTPPQFAQWLIDLAGRCRV